MLTALRVIFNCLEPEFHRDTTVVRSAPGGHPARPRSLIQARAITKQQNGRTRPCRGCCQPGMLTRQVHFARHQPAKHCRGPHGRSWAAPHEHHRCETPVRHSSRLCTASACQYVIFGSCGGLSAPSNDTHRHGEQRYRRARLSGIISQQPAIHACGQT